MRHYRIRKRQKGVVMLVSLLMLVILSLIGIAAISTSVFELRMAGNIQNMYESFQSADAGIAAAMSDGGVFDGTDKADIFAGGDAGTVEEYIVAEVNVGRLLPEVELTCPRGPGASSVTFIGCEHYTVDSEHENDATGARTHVYQGAVREILVR